MLNVSELSDEKSCQLLFVDDEVEFLEYARKRFESIGYSVVTATSWDEVKDELKSGKIRPEVIFAEPVRKNGSANGSVLSEILEFELTARIPVVALSFARDPRKIVEAIKMGARDYVFKPFSVREVDQVIQAVLENQPVTRRTAGKTTSVEFVFGSPAMDRVRSIAQQIADTSVPVLITGESGTGKDVIARYIHQQSNLRDQPFVKVNCAAMPAELVESELFGYTKGAFTGAYIDRPGKFEFANGGTIFLDEIGEFTSSVQAKLLQVLQDGRFTRLGSNAELEVEVRVIAATNRKLDEAMKDGTFREDLFYRLNVVNIEIPPLRQRREEIPLFCDFFIRKFAEQYRSDIESVPEELMKLLMSYHWPGNVRELENLIKRFIVLQDQQSLEKELESKISRRQLDDINEVAEHYLQEYDGGKVDLKKISKKAASIVEKNMIKKALSNTQWNKWQAAKELKVSYKTLLNKMEEYSIEMGK